MEKKHKIIAGVVGGTLLAAGAILVGNKVYKRFKESREDDDDIKEIECDDDDLKEIPHRKYIELPLKKKVKKIKK